MKQAHSLSVLNRLAESYVRLVLAVGQHDADEVDAFTGPEQWKAEAAASALPLETIKKRALAALGELKMLSPARLDEMLQLRHRYLQKQLQALIARIDLVSGTKMTFDEESRALYDAVAPTHTESHFREILEVMSALLPGNGSVAERYERFKQDFIIPKDRLDKVFSASITESRRRTKEHIPLPENEQFTVEYVNNKSWSGYNWYKGGSTSLIQVNTDFPITIDRAIDLASHEGYPGHHVYNTLLEKNLAKERRWVEFTIFPLFSPQALIAEGTANFGIEMAYPGRERVTFEQHVLFPMAGLDPSKTEKFYEVFAVFLKLAYAGNEAARKYLNGEITREEAARWLTEYALMGRDRSLQRTRFFDQYRSYVINYNLGQDLVKRYLESRGGTPERPKERWAEFQELLSSPRLPSGLVRTGGPQKLRSV